MDTDGQERPDEGTDMAPGVSSHDDDALPLGLIPGCLTVDQAAAKAGVTTKTIRRWLESGALPSQMVRRGRTRVLQISPADLEKAVRSSGKRKVRASPLPVLLEDTKLALQESRLRHESELAEMRTALALEQSMRQAERAKLTTEAEIIRRQAEEQRAEDLRQREEDQKRRAEDLATQKSQAEAVRLALAEVKQALYESKSEAHELKAQLSMLQDQVLRALPAPPESVWQRIGRALGIGRK